LQKKPLEERQTVIRRDYWQDRWLFVAAASRNE
jgi:hypothetical protein